MSAERELQAAVEAAEPRLEVPMEQVRILWAEVGIDRLTLEMFGQLHDVPWDRIEPVARVQPPKAGEYVIGAGPDGFLARASFSEAWTDVPRTDREERRLIDDLIRLRERVAEMEVALERRAAFEVERERFRTLPLVLLVPERKKAKEEG